ncbi:hypothetical protein OG788_25210 [Streptomyces sp. NBC_00647]|uniref:hypothetical protein n=1 Tax=unclassified Streptomyces TaxID=2593676 RepID=UPI0032558982
MESGPAIFAGAVFTLFGGGILAWTVVRVRQGESVAHGVNRVASATLSSVAGSGALALGMWCFTRV